MSSYVHNNSVSTPARYHDGEMLTVQQTGDSLGTGRSWIYSIAALVSGLLLQYLIHTTIDPVIFGLLIFSLGLAVLRIPGLSDKWSRRAFLLTFCTCVLIAGVNQVYHHYYAYYREFGPFLFSDEGPYYNEARVGIVNGVFRDLLDTNRLNMVVWRIFYSLSRTLGLGDGMWIGPTVNALIVGFVANTTVLTARYIVGPDERRLRRAGTMCAACGLFWLYGAFYLRDCFALLLNVIVLWSLVRVLCISNVKNLLIMVAAVAIAFVSMGYVREGIVGIFIVFSLLALLTYVMRRGASGAKLVFLLGGLLLAVALFHYVGSFVGEVIGVASRAAGGRGFGVASYAAPETGSLARKMVTSQPLPIRLITGSLWMLVFPIPLWASFRWGGAGYHWVKGANGWFMVLVMPLVLFGIGSSIKRILKGSKDAPIGFFLFLYFFVSLFALAASSLETRHLGQFLPSVILLATIADLSIPKIRKSVISIAYVWFGFVFLYHVMWATLKIAI